MPKVRANNITMNYDQQGAGEMLKSRRVCSLVLLRGNRPFPTRAEPVKEKRDRSIITSKTCMIKCSTALKDLSV